MEDERPKAEKKLGLFLSPSTQGESGFLVPMNPLTVGPGEPGPEDEWHIPPVGELAAETPEDEWHVPPSRRRKAAREPAPAAPEVQLAPLKKSLPHIRGR